MKEGEPVLLCKVANEHDLADVMTYITKKA